MADETKQPWTPGPWEARESGDAFMVDAATGSIAVVFGVERTTNGGITGVAGNEGGANAVLMAAAPAMAEALAELVTAFEGTQEFLGDGIQLRRTLATTRALETAQTALTIAASRGAEEDEARTGYLSLMGKFYEHLELMIRYLEEETSQGDGIAEEHHDGYRAAKALVERTGGLEGLWERAQIDVHEIKRERDEAMAEVARRDALAVSVELMTRTQIDQIRAESKTLVAELETALETALEWMEGRFGNTDGLDCGDESAAAVADALDAALAKAKVAANG